MGVAADGGAGNLLAGPLMQVAPAFERLSIREDRPLRDDLSDDVRHDPRDREEGWGSAEEEFKVPSAVEREFPGLVLRDAGRERETGGVDGKPAVAACRS